MAEFLDALIQFGAFTLFSTGSIAVARLAPRLASWLRLQDDERVRAYLLTVVQTGIEFGVAEARRKLAGQAAPASQVQANVAAELARDYVQSRVPDALSHFGIDTVGLDQMIRARMPTPRAWVGG